MIESVFGVLHSSKNYYLDLQELDFIVKYVLDIKYNINPNDFELRINSINDVTVFFFKEYNRDDIFIKIINEPYSYSNENKVKKKILEDIFYTKSVIDEVIYEGPFDNRVSRIRFTIIEDFDENNYTPMVVQILNNPQIDILNKQIEILNKKKLQIIKSSKR